MAPEILKKSKYGPKVDIFSTGVVIYTMLTRNSPFSIGNVEERLLSNKKCKICFSEKIWNHYSYGLFNFVSKLLRKNPKERPSIDESSRDAWLLNHHKGLIHREIASSLGSDMTSSSNSDRAELESKTLEMSWERELGCLRKPSDFRNLLEKNSN
ncbi:unnamed protein product [Blepharisma stoltei]|uniref:Protein kinase domain-containing protein n=1 Tax=Blepharisma stoltei TaxID=1481888 RepID=A0AAU9J3I0_9CILI|nr:unnamed protein product [Blepharisma stoltei]